MKVLALDLEGTLISNAVSQFPRPGLFDFLEFCHSTFDRIVMFTCVREAKFRQIATTLAEEGSVPQWFTTLEVVDWYGVLATFDYPCKDLRFIKDIDLSTDVVYLIDDMQDYVCPGQEDNWISISTYYAYPDGRVDVELERVREEIEKRLDK